MAAEALPNSVPQEQTVTEHLPRGANWRQYGACRGLEPDIFFPEDDADADLAKKVCDSCIVRLACLEFALETREKEGVWGGATERERRRIIRQRQRANRLLR